MLTQIDMNASRVELAQTAVTGLIEKFGSRIAAANFIGVNSSFITHLMNHDKLFPKLEDALIEGEFIPPKKRRNRLSINKDDMFSAAKTLHAQLDSQQTDQLMRYLGMAKYSEATKLVLNDDCAEMIEHKKEYLDARR